MSTAQLLTVGLFAFYGLCAVVGYRLPMWLYGRQP